MSENDEFAVIAVDRDGRTFDIGPTAATKAEADAILYGMRERMGSFAAPYVVAQRREDGAFRPIVAEFTGHDAEGLACYSLPFDL